MDSLVTDIWRSGKKVSTSVMKGEYSHVISTTRLDNSEVGGGICQKNGYGGSLSSDLQLLLP